MGFRERILSTSRRNKSRVVLALDVVGPLETRIPKALKLLDSLNESLAAVKLGQQLLLPFGLVGLEPLIASCNEKTIPLIADIKLNDIESTNLDVIESLYSRGIQAVIANPFVGYKEGLAGVLETSRELGLGVILLVYMSHAGAREGYGLKTETGETISKLFAQRARRWGVDGAVVSAKSTARIREVRRILREDQFIFSPGVGAQGGDAAIAASAGSDFLIVGRSIIESPDPEGSVNTLRESVRLASP